MCKISPYICAINTKQHTTHATMNTKHTPGPWTVDGTRIKAYRENGYTKIAKVGDIMPANTDEANARRIVECVNACEGIADPSAVKDLLEALQTLVQMTGNVGQIEAFLNGTARAVIAKANGTNA